MTAHPAYYVTGNTYPHRATLRSRGLTWDASRKAWSGTADQVRDLDGMDGLRVVDGTMASWLLEDADDRRASSARYTAEDYRLAGRIGFGL